MESAMTETLNIVMLGLSITSSWGNGHATTYRALARALHHRGHRVLFLERDQPWYAQNRDLPNPGYATVRLYGSLEELADLYTDEVARADLALVGSYVPEGAEVGRWMIETARGVRAFYDIDTPITLNRLATGCHDYLHPSLIPEFDLYLSFTGGPLLDIIHRFYHAARVEPLYCSVDPELYFPEEGEMEFDLGYMGTYSEDRQPTLDELLIEPARRWPTGRFTVVGPQFPNTLGWPQNVRHLQHLSPDGHRRFYTGQRFTLNVTRREMIRAGWSPSVRLFEAAACGTPIISDDWRGLNDFFKIGDEILVARTAADVLRYLSKMPEATRRRIGENARARVLAAHTSAHRALELEHYVRRVRNERAAGTPATPHIPLDSRKHAVQEVTS
jgi:spore maturation protein CgeB